MKKLSDVGVDVSWPEEQDHHVHEFKKGKIGFENSVKGYIQMFGQLPLKGMKIDGDNQSDNGEIEIITYDGNEHVVWIWLNFE
jgi:hypothetical protein